MIGEILGDLGNAVATHVTFSLFLMSFLRLGNESRRPCFMKHLIVMKCDECKVNKMQIITSEIF